MRALVYFGVASEGSIFSVILQISHFAPSFCITHKVITINLRVDGDTRDRRHRFCASPLRHHNPHRQRHRYYSITAGHQHRRSRSRAPPRAQGQMAWAGLLAAAGQSLRLVKPAAESGKALPGRPCLAGRGGGHRDGVIAACRGAPAPRREALRRTAETGASAALGGPPRRTLGRRRGGTAAGSGDGAERMRRERSLHKGGNAPSRRQLPSRPRTVTPP